MLQLVVQSIKKKTSIWGVQNFGWSQTEPPDIIGILNDREPHMSKRKWRKEKSAMHQMQTYSNSAMGPKNTIGKITHPIK